MKKNIIIYFNIFFLIFYVCAFGTQNKDEKVDESLGNNLLLGKVEIDPNITDAEKKKNRLLELRKKLAGRFLDKTKKENPSISSKDIDSIKHELLSSKDIDKVMEDKERFINNLEKKLNKKIDSSKKESFQEQYLNAGVDFEEEERILEHYEENLKSNNDALGYLKKKLRRKYNLVKDLYDKEDSLEKISLLKDEIQVIKDKIYELESITREDFVNEKNSSKKACYAYWDRGQTTLSNLVIEYGSTDYLYVIPPELMNMKISLFSSIPIPHESWGEMIEMILQNNGIGIRKLSPFLRQLYILKQDLSNVEAITTNLEDISHLQEHSLIFYIFSPSIENVKATQMFFERYSDPKKTSVQIIGNKLVIVAAKQSIERLMKLYKAIWEDNEEKTVKVITLSKVSPLEMEKVIKSFYVDNDPPSRGPFLKQSLDNVLITPLPDRSSIVLVGEKRIVHRTENLIKQLEGQLEDPTEMTIFWYTCKHSDPNELAEILNRVYGSLTLVNLDASSFSKRNEAGSKNNKVDTQNKVSCDSDKCNEVGKNVYRPVNPVPSNMVMPGVITKEDKETYFSQNFVVDGKTGSILMIVKREALPQLKEVLKKLDVPKKMVQIEVLLVEKKLLDEKQSGINILKIGTNDVTEKKNAFTFDASEKSNKKGIIDLLFMKPKGNFPSFDITLSFLMSQQDLQINANPSVLAINQTPAKISIVEEISINNGAVIKDCPTGSTVEQSYTRTQYGITIKMIPTVHLADENDFDNKGFVTLQTDVSFDTPELTRDNFKPPVTRRNIQNEVRVADGETVIIGGLRKHAEQDNREKIPFLGDLPGIGKLFGTTKVMKNSTEMFIFITPKIIKDPIEDLRMLRQKELCKRPGDLPEFIEALQKAKERERKKLFRDSIKVLFD